MQLPVYSIEGKETGRKAELLDEIFGVEPNEHLIYEDVKRLMVHKRQGSASTKERAEVRGGGKKAYRQKGTGMARRGTIRSPLLKGGGTVFGPRPRKYKIRLTKKMRISARKSALSWMANNEAITILEDVNLEEPKTKRVKELLKSFDLVNKKVHFLTGQKNQNLILSTNNIQKVSVMPAKEANTYFILNADRLVILESGIDDLQQSIDAELVKA